MGILTRSGQTHLKCQYQLVGKFIIIFFLKYCKLQKSYFGYFGHVWPLPSKTIMPTCRKFDIYLHVKKRTPTSFL